MKKTTGKFPVEVHSHFNTHTVAWLQGTFEMPMLNFKSTFEYVGRKVGLLISVRMHVLDRLAWAIAKEEEAESRPVQCLTCLVRVQD